MMLTSCSQTILSGDKWRICLDLARQIFGHQSGLHLDTAPVFDPGAKDRMGNFLVQPLLKAREEKLARLLLQTIGSQFNLEVVSGKHPVIEQRQYYRIDDERPEFFHQIEREGWSPIGGTMEKTDKLVETDDLHGTGNLNRQQRIAITEQGIDCIGWRTFDSAGERPLFLVSQHLAKTTEVACAS